jgi:hypothetical protein
MVLPFSFKKRFKIWLVLIPQFGSYAYRRREDNRERLYNIIDNE